MDNQLRILKIRINGVHLFENDILTFQFINHQNVHTGRDEENMINLFSSVYLPRIIALVGINASGKTSTLHLLAWVTRVFLCNEGMNNEAFEDVYRILKNDVTIEVFFKLNDDIYYERGHINIDTLNKKAIFEEDVIYCRSVDRRLNRSNLFDLDAYNELYNRKKLDRSVLTFLDEDKSITRLVTGKINVNVVDLINHNIWKPSAFGSVNDLVTIVRFLDHSIEELSPLNENNSLDIISDETIFQLRFMGGELKVLRWIEILDMLSSGTKKGLVLFQLIKNTLHQGGYLIIDEIENHFNKSIVVDIYKMFRSKRVNPLGAMLVFSTHYTELMDDFDRNDQIYITSKSQEDNRIKVVNLSDLIKRTDLKKSDVYFSDMLDIGTATRYDLYMDLQRSLTKEDESLSVRDGSGE